MCTVTFIPLKENGFLLTSNRDEKTDRPAATPPIIEKDKQYSILYPKDPRGGGTWIAVDDRNNAVCLMNGAFNVHKPQYPYRHSRGLVVIDFFNYENLFDFTDLYDLNNIEPFTVVIIQDYSLYEFRWDGEQRHLRSLPFDKPHIWSSVTLYKEEVIRKREEWFAEWLSRGYTPSVERILDFHLFAGEGDKKSDVLMERDDGLKTISITSILNENNSSTMRYKDLIRREEIEKILTSKTSH